MATEPARTLAGLSYGDLVQALFPRLTGGIRWGIERTERMLVALGDPHLRYPVIHVGGTNGKGSVAASIAAVLSAAGLRTGLYTSPHLCTFRERIRLDGRAIEESALLSAATRAWPEIERHAPSFFEATTVIAFEAFARAGVDIAVVEVGLGGRLDATNVVRPTVTVLTNVARDHMEFLGNTLESIAREKAGIIKASGALLTAERRPRIRAIFAERAAERGLRLQSLDRSAIRDVRLGLDGIGLRLERTVWGRLALHSPLPGRHQVANTALAVRALEALPAGLRPDAGAVRAGIAAVRWPGRLQVERAGAATWILDAAHNPAGMRALLAALAELAPPRPLVAVAAVLADKEWERMLAPLARLADALILTVAPTAPENRRWDAAEAAARLAARTDRRARIELEPDFAAALDRAGNCAGRGSVLVTGSFHTVGDAMAARGWARDGVDAYLPLSPSAV